MKRCRHKWVMFSASKYGPELYAAWYTCDKCQRLKVSSQNTSTGKIKNTYPDLFKANIIK